MITPGVYITSSLMNIMINAVTKASRGLVRDFGELDNIKVSRKGSNDFLTSADLRSEKVIIQELTKVRPDYSILSEESGLQVGENKEYCWLIDPLDGTVNFVRGIPFWCISLALKRGDSVIAGVVYDPLRNECFFAEEGKGAFLNNRRLRLAPVHYLDEALVSFSGVKSSVVAKIFASCLSGRKVGSQAISLAYVAAGRFDAFVRLDGTNSWDTAAGTLIATEAGAVFRSDSADVLEAKSLTVSGLDIADEFWDLVTLEA